MRTLFSVAVAALALALSATNSSGQQVSLPLGTEAPPASLEDLDGNTVQILDYIGKGKPTLVEFWATWCGVCRRLQPEMDRVYSTYGDRANVLAVAVAVSQTPERVRQHIESHGSEYLYLWDGEGEAVRNYGAQGTGIVLIFDEEGRVVYNGTGADQPLAEEVRKILGG
jgi:thiol-disulfide isomerase/thioredoxin